MAQINLGRGVGKFDVVGGRFFGSYCKKCRNLIPTSETPGDLMWHGPSDHSCSTNQEVTRFYLCTGPPRPYPPEVSVWFSFRIIVVR